MKAAAFEYDRPASLSAAVSALKGTPGSRVISGGQSLGPMLNLRLVRPQKLIDISRIRELQQVADEGGFLRIGAAVTHSSIEDGLCTRNGHDFLGRVARGIAYRAVRNRGTVGGSLAHADPAADWVTVLSALDSKVVVTGTSGEREEALTQFLRSPFTTSLQSGEILSAVKVPIIGDGFSLGYYKHCRKVGEFPDASAAVVIDAARRRTRVVIGALGSMPKLVPFDLWPDGEIGALPALDVLMGKVATVLPEAPKVELQIRAATLQRALSQVSK